MASTSNPARVGGLLALAVAAVMAGMVWAPWITGFGEDVTGWDIHEQATGSQQWYIKDFLDADFSPFFPALPILVAAGLVGLAALSVFSRKELLSGGVSVMVRLIGVLAFLVALVDPLSVAITGPGGDVVFFDWGLIGVVVGAGLGVIGFSVASGTFRRQRRSSSTTG